MIIKFIPDDLPRRKNLFPAKIIKLPPENLDEMISRVERNCEAFFNIPISLFINNPKKFYKLIKAAGEDIISQIDLSKHKEYLNLIQDKRFAEEIAKSGDYDFGISIFANGLYQNFVTDDSDRDFDRKMMLISKRYFNDSLDRIFSASKDKKSAAFMNSFKEFKKLRKNIEELITTDVTPEKEK